MHGSINCIQIYVYKLMVYKSWNQLDQLVFSLEQHVII